MQQESGKRYIYFGIFILIALAFIIKLFQLQVMDSSYKQYADLYAIRRIVRYPARGNILDRNGKLMVSNEFAYNLIMTPADTKPIDTLDFCRLADISKEEFVKITSTAWRRIDERKQSKTETVPIVKDLTKESIASIREKLYKFPGYSLEEKTLRIYQRPIAAHILGEVGEVDTSVTNNNPYYRPGDYIGRSGIEKSYEEILRGIKGVRKVFVDVHNNEKGSYLDGMEDTASVQGENLTITLDMDLQEYGELLMQNKKGAIVAIEPATGEVLVLLSSPTYDPNLLVGRGRRKNYPTLLMDENKPLYNRAIMDGYPPGSTFKVFQALVGQQEEVVFPSTIHGCGGGFRLSATQTVGCHGHRNADLQFSITTSCNAYYCKVFNSVVRKYRNPRIGYTVWREYALRFGFGKRFEDTDIPNIKSGNVPTPDYYDKVYRPGGWTGMTVISLGIGQGELQANALQIANLAAIVANQGWYITPHVGKKIGDKEVNANEERFPKHYVGVDQKYFDVVIRGMYGAVHEAGGTAGNVRLDSIPICGKTGTAQNPHGENHSVFMCFAPRKNPKIAIGVLVENAGYGGTWAAPIASLLVEKYLNGVVKRKYMEDHIMNANLMGDQVTNANLNP